MKSNQTTVPIKYTVVPDPYEPDAPYWCVRLDEGEFAGTIVHLHSMHIPNIGTNDEQLKVSFHHDIKYIPEELRMKEFPESKRLLFVKMCGEIMMDMVHENLQEEEFDDGPVGNDDSEKLIVRRKIHTQGDPFLKR